MSLSTSPRFVALDVADAFLETQNDSDPDHTMLVRDCAFFVGSHVAEHGHAGDWSQMDAKSFFEEIAHLGEHELIGVSLVLIGLFGWLGSSTFLRPEVCASVVQDIADHCPNVGFLHDLATSGLQMLDSASEMPSSSLLN